MNDWAAWLAPILGGALQQLRAFKGFPEWGYFALATVAGVFCLWLWNDNANLLTKVFWQEHVPQLVTFVTSVLGGTFVASSAAKAGAPAALAPQTNS